MRMRIIVQVNQNIVTGNNWIIIASSIKSFKSYDEIIGRLSDSFIFLPILLRAMLSTSRA